MKSAAVSPAARPRELRQATSASRTSSRPSTSTADVFDAAHRERVAGVLKGYDCTLAAYGTGSRQDARRCSATRRRPASCRSRCGASSTTPQADRRRRSPCSSRRWRFSLSAASTCCTAARRWCSARRTARAALVFHGLRERARSEAEVLALLHQAMEARTIGANSPRRLEPRAHRRPPPRRERAPPPPQPRPPPPPPARRRAVGVAAGRGGPLDALLQRARDAGLTTEALAAKMTANVAAGKFSEAHYRDDVDARGSPRRRRKPPTPTSLSPRARRRRRVSRSAARLAPRAGRPSRTTLRDATSATLMLIDLLGSAGPTLNSSHAAVAQGVASLKSLHWLRVAVHALTAWAPAKSATRRPRVC